MRPLWSMLVLCMWVARSLSPSLNHVSAPSFSSACRQLKVSPAMPQPLASSTIPARVYVRMSRSGLMWRS